MAKHTFNETPPPRLGVGIDTIKMTMDEVFEIIDESMTSYATNWWNTAYAMSTAYHRPSKWAVGIAGHYPTEAHFCNYVRKQLPHRNFTDNEILTFVKVYDGYAATGDEEVVKLVGQAGGASKAMIARPWAVAPENKNKVKSILRLCTETTQANLKDALRENFPINGRPAPKVKLSEDGKAGDGNDVILPPTDTGIRAADKVLGFLADAKSPVIGQKMLVPRTIPFTQSKEWAMQSIVEVYQRETHISPDDLYFEMFTAWLDAMPAVDRARRLKEAHARWTISMETLGVASPKWPFETTTTRKAA